MSIADLQAIQQAIFLNEARKLDTMMSDPKYYHWLLRTFDQARDYKGIDGSITLLHYAVYCDAFDCAEVLLKYGGKTLRDKPATSGNYPRDIANRIFLENFSDMFDQFVPAKGFVEPYDESAPKPVPVAIPAPAPAPVVAPTPVSAPVVAPVATAVAPQSQTFLPDDRQRMASIGGQRTSTNKAAGVPPTSPGGQLKSSSATNQPVSNSPQNSPQMVQRSASAHPNLQKQSTSVASSTPPAAVVSPRPNQTSAASPVPTKEEVDGHVGRLFSALYSNPSLGDLDVLAFGSTYRVHSFVLSVRCPSLMATPDCLKEASPEAVSALLGYLYMDDFISISEVSIPTLFEVWGMSLDLHLIRLEMLIQEWIRKNVTMENAVELAQCMNDFSLMAEYLVVLKFIKVHSAALKPALLQHRALALSILRANEQDFPQNPITVPAKTLKADLSKMLQTTADVELIVKDLKGQTLNITTHRAILAASTEYFAKHPDIAGFSPTWEIISFVPLKTFAALVTFFYTGTMNFSATDCIYLFLAHPNWKRLSSLSPAETKELEGTLAGFDSQTLSWFTQSDLKTILPPNLASFATPATTPRSTPVPAAVSVAPVVATASPRAPQTSTPAADPLAGLLQVPVQNLSAEELKMEQMLARSPLVKSLLAQIDALNKRIAQLERHQ